MRSADDASSSEFSVVPQSHDAIVRVLTVGDVWELAEAEDLASVLLTGCERLAVGMVVLIDEGHVLRHDLSHVPGGAPHADHAAVFVRRGSGLERPVFDQVG